MRYPAYIADQVRDPAARQHLQDEGLPDEHVLFRIYPPSKAVLRHLPNGKEALCIGVDHEVLDLCIDVDSGAVFEIHSADDSVWHVNASTQQFAMCLDAFSRRYPFGDSSNDLDVAEQGAAEFAAEVRAIDNSALDAEGCFWDTVVVDILSGDYAAS